MTNDFKARKNGGIYSMKQKLSPEEYKRFKEEEKSNVYQLIDSAVETIVINPDEMKKYLDTQARMDRYSAANALLIYKQCPEATQLNPFVYLRDDNDIQRLVTNLFKSTTPKGSQSNDPFWDTAASMLLLALVFYLHYEAPEEEQNFAMVMEMLRAAEIEDEDSNVPSPLDNLFNDLEFENPDHIALKYYHSYHSGSAKTLKSIQITLAARLEKFNLESLAALTSTDELDLPSMGEKKVALFALIPDNDSSFNFLVSILYTQLFQQLFYSADHIHGGALPVPVHFLMDEFANETQL